LENFREIEINGGHKRNKSNLANKKQIVYKNNTQESKLRIIEKNKNDKEWSDEYAQDIIKKFIKLKLQK
jgi:hypothetical protein